jgi:hypothetical protein
MLTSMLSMLTGDTASGGRPRGGSGTHGWAAGELWCVGGERRGYERMPAQSDAAMV